MKNIYVKETSDLGEYSKENVTKLGKTCVESLLSDSMKYNQKWKSTIEGLKTMKEQLDVSESDLYTTAITSFIEEKMRPELVVAQVIKVIDNFDTRGQNAIKVPSRAALITAADLPDSGALSYATGSYTSTTITLTYKYAANNLTHELIKFANVDLIAEELGEIGSALARKLDGDIITALQTATTSLGSNAVEIGTGTYVTYARLVDAQAAHKALYAKPDVLLIAPSTTAVIMQLSQFSGASNLVGTLIFKGDKGEHFPPVTSILGMRLVESTQVDDDDVFLIDTQRTGYLVKAGGVETFDGRISGYLAWEVIGALNYGISVVQTDAVYRIQENTGAGV